LPFIEYKEVIFMKKVLILTVALILSCSSAALATGLFGPAQPQGKGGTVSLGPGFLAYTGEWDGDTKAEQIQAYAQLGVSLTDNFEIYLQGGAADLQVEAFDEGYRPFGTLGVKILFTDSKPVNVGFFAQGTYFDDYEGLWSSGESLTFTKNWEADGGIVLQTMIEGALLYGGPIFYAREGDVEIVTTTTNTTSSYEEQGNFGGFLGIRWPLKSGINIDIEAQYKTEFSGGGAIHFLF
jgi:hypothetical protein